MNKYELNKILESHRLWRESKGKEGMRAILSGIDGVDLSGADLRGAKLCEAILVSGIGLCNANLRGADLYAAELTAANLSGADLREADLIRANLTAANLSGADLREVLLNGARLVSTNLKQAIITGAWLYAAALDDWKIDGVKCDYIFWDLQGNKRTPQNRDFEPGEFEKRYTHLKNLKEIILDVPMSELTYYTGLMAQWKVNKNQPNNPIKLKSQEALSDKITKLVFVDFIPDNSQDKETQEKLDYIEKNINTFIRNQGLIASKKETVKSPIGLKAEIDIGPLPIVVRPKEIERIITERYNELPSMLKTLWHCIQCAF